MIYIKVAIIGAGVSGLSCAVELTRNGIVPTIFEKESQIGNKLDFTAIWLRIFTQHFTDPLHFIKKTCKLSLGHIYPLNEIVMKFPSKEVRVKGKLGYILKRGSENFSLEKQIAAHLNIPIRFNEEIKATNIKKDFDFVVVASGVSEPAREVRAWTDTLSTHTRITRVLGKFELGVAKIWLNTKYAKNTFCYLVPNSTTEACLAQIVDGISMEQIESYWSKFVEMEKLDYKVSEYKDIAHYMGIVQPMRVGNILFIGNAGGLADDLIGIGAYNAINSGVLAAQSIINKLDYNAIIKPYTKNMINIHEFRKMIKTFDNNDYDCIGTLLGTPGIKQFVYNNPLFKIWHMSFLVKMYNYMGRS